jgi:hypothetical protein
MDFGIIEYNEFFRYNRFSPLSSNLAGARLAAPLGRRQVKNAVFFLSDEG